MSGWGTPGHLGFVFGPFSGLTMNGGGDIAFPLLLTASVYFARGLGSSLIIAAFGFAGLVMAYLIQSFILKGKPIPALPPIALLSLIGLLIVIL